MADEEIPRASSWTKELLSLWSLGPRKGHVEEVWLTNQKALWTLSFWVFVEAYKGMTDLTTGH